jgi:hypothetical protein
VLVQRGLIVGHDRLGRLPKTRRWKKVIELLRITDDPGRIADATSQAAEKGLKWAGQDRGVADVLFLLMKTVYAAREENFSEALAKQNVSVPQQASLLDVVAGFDRALNQKLRANGHRSDLAEMARGAAVDTLMDLCRKEAGSLFGVSTEETRRQLKTYSTPDQFGHVGQNFFGRFLFRFLDYHLSRELPNHVGLRKSFDGMAGVEEFKKALSLYCQQSARIVREFSGCWPSATEYHEGIDYENVRTKFLPIALKKIGQELQHRGGRV